MEVKKFNDIKVWHHSSIHKSLTGRQKINCTVYCLVRGNKACSQLRPALSHQGYKVCLKIKKIKIKETNHIHPVNPQST
jgi:hypothetical protein